ncbi:hypothetical protein [Peptacetobacter sp. AB845]
MAKKSTLIKKALLYTGSVAAMAVAGTAKSKSMQIVSKELAKKANNVK